jgi:hypothetical protein
LKTTGISPSTGRRVRSARRWSVSTPIASSKPPSATPTDTGTDAKGRSALIVRVHWCSWSVGPCSTTYAAVRVSPTS